MMQKIMPVWIDYLKQWEGLKLEAYRDVSSTWTIGYGHTAEVGDPKPKEGMTITKRKAEEILLQDLKKFEKIISSLVTVSLNDTQFSALVSFCFNIGSKNFANSTLLKKLNNKDYEAVPSELVKWVYIMKDGKKVFSSGLAKRRAEEAELWGKQEKCFSNKHSK